jgi:Fanconi anemia group J protein
VFVHLPDYLHSTPRIYYGTRTHKQIAHIVNELRKTRYRHVKYTILGSREQTCINRQLRGHPDKTAQCRELLAEGGVS